ncbi:MAG: serine hydrolase [Verrucomicrobiota bacterium]
MNMRSVLRPGLSLLSLFALATTGFTQPVLTNQPRTQFQWENRRVSLNITVPGTGPLTYQWQFNGADIAGAHNRTYTLSKVQLTNDGNFRVIVANSAGPATSEVARVMVRAWPHPTGPSIPELAQLDTNLQNVMLANAVPGASLAVVKDGRLVLSRGYGFADVETRERYEPDSLCRSASIAKIITAATLMNLVEGGKLDLDAPVLPVLALEPPHYPGAAFDSRWTNVTPRKLLNHTGGWNRDTAIDPLGAVGFDPAYWPDRPAQDLGLETRARPIDMVRWMLGKPMQSKPGAAVAYSNFGYILAGTLIEKLAGAPYEEAARKFLLKGGITRMRVAGDARGDRKPGEAAYYLHPSIEPDWALDQVEPRPFDFELPYAWPVSYMAASGGWLISAIDFARFVASIDADPAYPDILATNTVAMMTGRSSWPGLYGGGYLGFGWDSVSPTTGVWLKGGFDTGWRTFAAKYKNGTIVIYTMNTAWTGLGSYDLWSTFSTVLNGIRQWPAHDLFPATLSYDAWRTKYFSASELADSSISGDHADPDGDGLANLLEYSCGTDPYTPSETPRISLRAKGAGDQNGPVLTYRRLLLAHEVDYAVETSDDLKTWSAFNGEPAEPLLNEDGTVTAQVPLNRATEQGTGFFRLRVTRKAQ